MKLIAVGFLAVVALGGCGVGVEGLEGEEAATGSTAAGLLAASADNSTSVQAEWRGPRNQDPRTALPQDPIPVFDSRTVAPVAPRPTK